MGNGRLIIIEISMMSTRVNPGKVGNKNTNSLPGYVVRGWANET